MDWNGVLGMEKGEGCWDLKKLAECGAEGAPLKREPVFFPLFS